MGRWGVSATQAYVEGFVDAQEGLMERFDAIKFGSLAKVAHETPAGEMEKVMHCSFCGSGKLAGRSDGTIECGLCKRTFTVSVQPEYPGMPQDPAEPGMEDPLGEGLEDPLEEVVEEPAEEPEKEKAVKPKAPAKDKPKKKKSVSSFYLTSQSGVVLDEENFTKHLALKYADNSKEMVKIIKNDNKGLR
jgi:hypothetical protein